VTKKFLKSLLKRNKIIFRLLSVIIYWYLKIVYATAKCHFIWPDNYDKQQFLSERKVIFAMWHNRLAFGPRIFCGQKNTLALVSSHADGKIISRVINKFGFGIIAGSTNRNPVGALKNIIQKLSSGANIVITPDGPRGPIYKINSNITTIAKKYNAKLIPISCEATKYFLLKSWDQLIMPLPFSDIKVIIGKPLQLLDVQEQNDGNLQQILMELGNL
jgi:lysophospholipid acyltransferase (LPLAT)-like uncharacterized protein